MGRDSCLWCGDFIDDTEVDNKFGMHLSCFKEFRRTIISMAKRDVRARDIHLQQYKKP